MLFINEKLEYREFKIIKDGNDKVKIICRYNFPNKDPSNWFFIKNQNAKMSYEFQSIGDATTQLSFIEGQNRIVELYGITEERFKDDSIFKNNVEYFKDEIYEWSPFEVKEYCIAKTMPYGERRPIYIVLARNLNPNTQKMSEWKDIYTDDSYNRCQQFIKTKKNQFTIKEVLK